MCNVVTQNLSHDERDSRSELSAQTRTVLEEAWELLDCAYHAHQKMRLEGEGNCGHSHEVRMFAMHFSQPETPKTPQHTILSGDGRYWNWRDAVKALHDARGDYGPTTQNGDPSSSKLPHCGSPSDATSAPETE